MNNNFSIQIDTHNPLKTIDAESLHNLLAQDQVLLIDVREVGEHKQEKIPHSILMPLSQFDPRKIPTTRDKLLVIYCQTSNRSFQAARKLINAGYTEVTHLQGGINAWKEAGYPTQVNKNAPISIMRQVQIIAGSLVLAGVLLGTLLAPAWYILSGFVGAGLLFAGLTGNCTMAILLAKLPYNQ
jgi:rhodanese-related sulfurtransferase